MLYVLSIQPEDVPYTCEALGTAAMISAHCQRLQQWVVIFGAKALEGPLMTVSSAIECIVSITM